uniref:Uncharacterized protein n=1 Tax=Anguilla anguilla TaxID=7936 RepID=A0A0E9UZI2_ANGAN
MTITLHYGM